MFVKLFPRTLLQLLSKKNLISKSWRVGNRNLSVGARARCKESERSEARAVLTLNSFDKISDKTKEAYLDMVDIYTTRDVHRRGHVEFIYSALRHMEEFGVHKDLDVYKSLINVLPKGKFIPTNVFQAEFMHYPKQQQCMIDLLQQMEDNGKNARTHVSAPAFLSLLSFCV